MYFNKLRDIQTADVTLSSEKKIPQRIPEFTDTERATLFTGLENFPILYNILME